MEEQAILKVAAVNFSFRTGFWLKHQPILFDVNFQLGERSIVGLLGSNGAGKTSLIHLITGLRQPLSGEVTVFGHPAHSLQARALMGYLPERPYFQEFLTGGELLTYYGTLAGMSGARIRSRIPEVLATVGMSRAQHLELAKYSKGMLQRIGVAQALMHDPWLLILDEPMSGLDPVGRKEMRELILYLASQGRSILFSSHVIPDVEAICKQIAILEKGKLIGFGPISQFLKLQISEIELGFAGSAEQLQKWVRWPEFSSTRFIAEGACGSVQKSDAVTPLVSRLIQEGATLLWVQPHRQSLEEFFHTERH